MKRRFVRPRVSSVCCRYGTPFEDVDMGRWVKHAEDKHHITVNYIVSKSWALAQDLGLLPLPESRKRTCTSSVMPGIGLGSAPLNMARQKVATWEECRDLCCKKHKICVSWTLLLTSKTCFLRKKVEKAVTQNENVISGITKSYVLPAPPRSNDLQFYVGILSAPNNFDRVHILYVNMAAYSFQMPHPMVFASCFW